MGSKLSVTNRYLSKPHTRRRAVIASVVTSSAIEGIRVSFKSGTAGRAGASRPQARKASVRSTTPPTRVKARRSTAKSGR